MYEVNVGNALKSLIDEILVHVKRDDTEGVLHLLNKMAANPTEIIAAMPKFDCEEVLLYADNYVTTYYIATPPKILYPPHEHGMVAISALYKGTETHIFYEKDGENVRERSRVTVKSPAVVDLEIDTVHAICTLDDVPNEGLHFYIGDLEKKKRNLWDISGFNPRQYDHQDYLKSAKTMP